MNLTIKVSDTGIVCDTYNTGEVTAPSNGKFLMTFHEEGYGYIHITDIPYPEARKVTKEDKRNRCSHWNVRKTTNPPGAWGGLFKQQDITVKWDTFKSRIYDTRSTVCQ